MAKVKTYWDEIKHQETHFYGGDQGWEIPFKWETCYEYNRKTGTNKQVKRLKLQFPFEAGDGVKTSEKKKCREEVNFQKRKRKILAQASRDRNEYQDLQNRLYKVDEDEFKSIIGRGMKGFGLGDYIRRNYLTNREGYALFYNM